MTALYHVGYRIEPLLHPFHAFLLRKLALFYLFQWFFSRHVQKWPMTAENRDAGKGSLNRWCSAVVSPMISCIFFHSFHRTTPTTSLPYLLSDGRPNWTKERRGVKQIDISTGLDGQTHFESGQHFRHVSKRLGASPPPVPSPLEGERKISDLVWN